MSTSKKLASYYTRLLSTWPTDPLRPLSFRSVLNSRLAQHSSPETSTSSTTTALPTQASELVQINALFSLVENRYATKYKLSPQYTQPRANPEYYDNLIRELDEAPTRSRWSNWVRSWKGYLRWK